MRQDGTLRAELGGNLAERKAWRCIWHCGIECLVFGKKKGESDGAWGWWRKGALRGEREAEYLCEQEVGQDKGKKIESQNGL